MSLGAGPGDRFVLAVSGGMDSMVMLKLFKNARLDCVVAHCNFQLRPAEAEEEEQLVATICKQYGIPFFATRLDTHRFAREHGLSIQLAARKLRYEFFEHIRSREQCNWVATAHHSNDSAETILLNLTRGTGLDGLTGIPAVNQRTLRPLLFATREEIHNYAISQAVSWREDSSNATDDYSRNLLRNKVIPLLREINPAFETTLQSNVARFREAKKIVDLALKELAAVALTRHGNRLIIQREPISKSASPAYLLWELIKEYGFHYDECLKIVNAQKTGKLFNSSSHRLLLNRDEYILEELTVDAPRPTLISEQDNHAFLMGLELHIRRYGGGIVVEKSDSIATVDTDKFQYPLQWRTWEAGDHFTPLGMHGTKKVSDFLVDHKVDRISKERVTVLESGGEIIWVVGMRISEKVKITPETKNITEFRVAGQLTHKTQAI